jgi:hypothetical protein
MKKIFTLLLVACFSATLFGQILVSTEASKRNIILEELTGKTCQFCPDGHKIAQNLMKQYPDRFFAINVHQGGYASGTPNYTTPYGNALASQAGMGQNNTGYPAGTVNRQVFSGVALMGASYFLYDRGKWASCASKGLAEASPLNVAAKGTINSENRKLTLLVEVYYTGNSVEPTNKLTLAMMQNEILGPQTGGQQYYPEMMVGGQYRHMHMLRDFITGQWGVDVSPTMEGSFWSQIFEYDIPEHFNNIDVVLENLEFVVFVAENTKTIISGANVVVEFGTSYKIEASAGENGTISSEGELNYPSNVGTTYTFIPDADYEVEEVFIDGEPMGMAQATEYTFPLVDKEYTIHVTFRLATHTTSYIITASADENGTITPAGETTYSEGESATYTFTPAANYEVEEVFIDGEPMDMPQTTGYTFTELDKDHTIHVMFRLIESIKDVNGITIAVAPNPIKDQLFVTGMYDKLEIFSISGQILTTEYNQSSIDVNNLAKGIYFVKIQTNGQICTFKIVK